MKQEPLCIPMNPGDLTQPETVCINAGEVFQTDYAGSIPVIPSHINKGKQAHRRSPALADGTLFGTLPFTEGRSGRRQPMCGGGYAPPMGILDRLRNLLDPMVCVWCGEAAVPGIGSFGGQFCSDEHAALNQAFSGP